MKERFRDVNLREASLAVVAQANKIIAEYQRQGLRLTLRQLYYQFVSRDLIANTQKEYKRLASIVSDGRLAGLIDWDAIEDRGREPTVWSEYDNVDDLIEEAARRYRLRRWDDQGSYVELWVEKQALAGVLEPLAAEHHVTLMVNKGYSSQSAMHESAQRFQERCERGDGGKTPVLFYLGDHDPSGEDMVRDIRVRMEMFGVADIDVVKIALTMGQIRQYKPPPNPAKITDPRARAYIAKHGNQSWEVDALPPDVLSRLIRDAFRTVIDADKMGAVIAREKKHKDSLRKAAKKLAQQLEDAP